jgi:DNA-directed RNA polymerase specialized sigma24 family protein
MTAQSGDNEEVEQNQQRIMVALLSLIARAIKDPDDQIIAMHKMGLNSTDIGQALGMPSATVRSTMHRRLHRTAKTKAAKPRRT